MVDPLEATAVTTPELLTVATAGFVLDQVPPPVEFVRFIVPPSHTKEGPPMAANVGYGFTVTEAVTGVAGHPFAKAEIVNTVVCEEPDKFVNAPGMEVVPPGSVASIPNVLAVLSLDQE